MKRLILSTIVLLYSTAYGTSQYLETFDTPNKGVLLGPCAGSDGTTCNSFDFDGVEWTIEGNLTGLDPDDQFSTSGGVLSTVDIDEEACYVSPDLDISAVAGAASLSVDLTWVSQDASDYIDVEWMIDNSGTWNQVPNVVGGGTHTIDYTAGGNTGSTTVTQGGLSGNVVAIRVCIDHNSVTETVTIDNVSVPQAGAVVLPVKWGKLSVEKVREGNEIRWSTESEINNDYFEVMRKGSGDSEFHSIAMVDGSGDSHDQVDYAYADTDAPTGKTYYRIKQVDLDGSVDYSDIVEITIEAATSDMLAYPHPFGHQLTLTRSVASESSVLGQLYTISGERVMEVIWPINANSVTVDTRHIPSGLYVMTIDGQRSITVVKE